MSIDHEALITTLSILRFIHFEYDWFGGCSLTCLAWQAFDVWLAIGLAPGKQDWLWGNEIEICFSMVWCRASAPTRAVRSKRNARREVAVNFYHRAGYIQVENQTNSWGVIGFWLFSSWLLFESLVHAGQDERIQNCVLFGCLPPTSLSMCWRCLVTLPTWRMHVAIEISPPTCLHAHCMS
jgi:hypothetical protein